MDIETGLSRTATVIHALGWAWLVGWALLTFIAFSNRGSFEASLLVLGAIGYVAAYAVAWIIRGFARKPQRLTP